MSQENQGGNSAAMSTILPMKRGRGRPRKYDTPFEREEARRRRRRRTESTSNGDHVLVGQMVSGVLDGSFDAGYLLTVRVGQTDTLLRGLVFKPGLSVPLSPANDVAPHAKMFTRSEVPLPVIQQQNLMPILAPAPQIQNGWPVMILPINMSALPLDFQAGTVVGIQQDDGNSRLVTATLEDINRAYQVATQPLHPEIKTENMSSSSVEEQSDAIDAGRLVFSHADQPHMKGKSANASPKEETTAETLVGKGEQSSPTAPQKLHPLLKNEVPVVIPNVMAPYDGPSSDVTRFPSALTQTEKPSESSEETKETLNCVSAPKLLKEQERMDRSDEQAATEKMLHLGLTPKQSFSMGIRDNLQNDKRVHLLLGQSRPVEPYDLQPELDKGAFNASVTNPAGISSKKNLA